MNTDLVAFAMKTENAHIAIVESNYKGSYTHFIQAQRQLHGMIESAHILEMKIKIVNGTMIYFFDASKWERLKGLRLDRIETVPAALRMMPERFLETRLKIGIAHDEGIFLSEEKQ